jgi:parvulin-like peptidyl-prolyl isomerase
VSGYAIHSRQDEARKIAFFAIFFAISSCAPESKLPPPNVVATIGGRELQYGEFEAYLERNVGESGGAIASEALSRLFDQYLEEESLATLSRERGLAPPAASTVSAIDALLAASPVAEPSPSEVAAELERIRPELARPERVHLRQILVEDRLAAERARRELAAGAEFDAVVARATPPGGAPAGADQGELARDELPQAFAAEIFALPDGGVSAVVPAGYGFHVFQVVRHLAAEEATLASSEGEIRERLRGAAADSRLATLAREARSRYTVEVYDRNLPFNYRGSFPTSRPHENR